MAAAAGAASAADTFTLRYSSTGVSTTAWNRAAARLAASVARRSNGRLRIDLYPTSQLAKEAESIAGLTNGVVDIALEASVFMEVLFPQMQVFTLPFMFKNYAAAFRAIDSPVGSEFFSQFETKGIVGLSWGSTGFREMESINKPIRVPSDLRGLRYRIQGGAVAVAMSQALGIIPVTIDIAEIYTALSQHTVDVVDNTPSGVIGQRYDTIITHLALTNHVFNFQPLLASKSKLESLPPDLQKILREEAKAVLPWWRSAMIQENADALNTIKSKGVTITDIDYPAFRKAMDPVYAQFEGRIGADLIKRVSAIANAS